MPSIPRRPSRRLRPLCGSPLVRTLLGLILVLLSAMTPPALVDGRAAGLYWLSSTPDGAGLILVDDDLDVYLNGALVHSDGVLPAGERGPIPVPNANVGDVLQFVLRDTYGSCAILSALYLIDPEGRSTPAMPQPFNQGCGNDPVNRGEVLNYSFVIPDLAASGPPFQEIAIPGNTLAGLTRGPGGYLYGVTYGSGNTGNDDDGKIFRVAPDFSAVETVYAFNGLDGQVPYGELILRGLVFYGTTSGGGPNGGIGTVFAFDTTTRQLTTLHTFPSAGPNAPIAPLLLLGDHLFGSAARGLHGALWRMKIDGTGYTTLHEFGGFDGSVIGGLTLGPNGYLYGTAVFGGNYGCDYSGGCGTVFRVRPDGTGPGQSGFELVWVFNSWRTGGGNPNRKLVLGSDGQLYGTGVKSVFRLSPNPAAPNLQVIHQASDTIWAPPIEGLDGRLYIAQYFDFVVGFGQVYSMTKAGTDVVLHHQFSASGAQFPYGMLFQDTPGTIFGTTEYSDDGSAFGRAFVIRSQSNRPPVAVANAPSTVAVGANCLADVVLDASASTDPDGDTLTYEWSENNLVIATGVKPTAALPIGTHSITLRVSDPAGASATAPVTVTVTSPISLTYSGPTRLQQLGSNVVQAVVSNASVPVAGAAITFSVNGTPFQAVSDAAGVASVDVGPVAGAQAIIAISYPAGPCGVEATTVAIPVNRWPTASAAVPATSVAGPSCTAQVAFDAAASSDPDGTALSYAWSEGGAPLASGVAPSIELSAGPHQVVLTVSDGNGGSATTTVAVTVQAQPSQAQYTGVTQFVAGTATAVTATLRTTANTPIGGATVTFALDGSTGSGVTDASGVATATVVGSTIGGRTLAVSYAGDSCHAAVSTAVAVNVSLAQRAPIAADRSVQTAEDVPVAVSLTASDPDNDPLTYRMVSGPSFGTLSGVAPALTYTPAVNFNGADSFTFKVNDGALDSNLATISIAVLPVNDPPTAVADAYTTTQATPLAVAGPGVLGNDTDVEGSPLTAVLITSPANGSLNLNADGSFAYTPAANFGGTDSFTYQASDGVTTSLPAIVSIAVASTIAPNFVAAANLSAARQGHTETLLPNGKVLVTGGLTGNRTSKSAELYDPATDTWSDTGNLAFARTNHTATLMSDGTVLVVGGVLTATDPGAELYNPVTGTWSLRGRMTAPRIRHSATPLQNGKVLVAGGISSTGAQRSAELYDPATGTWSAAASMIAARDSQTANRLGDGRVLVVGGLLVSAEIYDPTTNSWSATGSLTVGRRYHTATTLGDGTVLVVGGPAGPTSSLSTLTELYDPATGTWRSAGHSITSRLWHTATLLASGEVLVTGGQAGNVLQSAEIYSPARGTWGSAGRLTVPRYAHTATRLPGGKVLVVGGIESNGATKSAELYDRVSGTWMPTATTAARTSHTTTRLADGTILVAGGTGPAGALGTAQIFDSQAGTWRSVGPLVTPRSDHTATLLPNGTVLVAGGEGAAGVRLRSAEIFDPTTGTWTPVSNMGGTRSGHQAVRLGSGKVLIVGGAAGAEVYDPATASWAATGSPNSARFSFTATLLANGKVLIAGGSSLAPQSAEVYDPSAGTWTQTGPMSVGRFGHVALPLASGRVLVAGGTSGGNSTLNSAELFDPATGQWSAAAAMSSRRNMATATVLANGAVLVAGGTASGAGTLNAADVYNPSTGTWIATASMVAARVRFTLTALADGTAVAVGGTTSATVAEVFNPR